MTAQELRISNYVVLDKLAEITMISNDGDCYISYPDEKDVDDTYTLIKNIEPIPLTPEVLEACGFEREPFISALYQNFIRNGSGDYDGYCLSLRYPNYPVYLSCGTKFNFLHQLQNLYYALTSQELQIDIDKLKNAVK